MPCYTVFLVLWGGSWVRKVSRTMRGKQILWSSSLVGTTGYPKFAPRQIHSSVPFLGIPSKVWLSHGLPYESELS